MFKVIKKHWSLIVLLSLAESISGVIYIAPGTQPLASVLTGIASGLIIAHTFRRCFPDIKFLDFAAGATLTVLILAWVKLLMVGLVVGL